MCDYFLAADSNCIRFRDGSFAILINYLVQYTQDTTWLVTDTWKISENLLDTCPADSSHPYPSLPGALMFDEHGQPKAITAYFRAAFHYYQVREMDARWAWAASNVDVFENNIGLTTPENYFKVPQFRLLSRKTEPEDVLHSIGNTIGMFFYKFGSFT